nr:iron chelate uptake ABC transporter family permease subunit [Pseudoclavibacter sp. Marseille-Q3772]
MTTPLFSKSSRDRKTLRDSAERAAAIHRRNLRRDAIVIIVLALVVAAAAAMYVLYGIRGNIEYVIQRRLSSVAALAIVAIAIGVSTTLFQTITANRLLTPSIMGFDSLYILLQTVIVAATGMTGATVFGTTGQFWLEVGAMIGFSVLLYGWLLTTNTRVHKLLLIGVVFGMLFRGISTFLQRVLDPDAFAVLQNTFFASFTDIDKELVPFAAALTAVGCAIAWYDRKRMDVMSLGVPIATNLGVNPRNMRIRMLAVVALLVSVSTALVGPVTFFGLIVVHLAYRSIRVARHALLLPAASLIGMVALILGQVLVERVFKLDITLSIIIEFLGGLLFLALVLRRKHL